MTGEILETALIDRLVRDFAPAPHKIGRTHEADAEIVDMGDGGPHYLAITTDALSEEIASGLYDDPEFIGWMIAMVNFSDLAAVGADPLGLLLSLSLPPDRTEAFVGALTRGVSEACRRLGTFVLGGDTNEGERLALSGCAVGLVPKSAVLTRKGAAAGDRLYLSAPAGLGNAFAFLKLGRMSAGAPEGFYRPVARIREGRIVRAFARCVMDTSDGVLHTVDTLARLNRRRFVLDGDWARICHPLACRITRAHGLPAWLSLAGVHGEFELMFAVPPADERRFLVAAGTVGWSPVRVGEILEGEGVCIRTAAGLVPVDTGAVRNLSHRAGSDPIAYVRALIGMAGEWGIPEEEIP